MPERQTVGQMAALRSAGFHVASANLTDRLVSQVQQFSLFLDMSPADCKAIVSAAHEKEFQRREAIYLEGDPVRQVFLLTSGCVKIMQFGQKGTEVILRLNGPGEVVGTVGLCTQGRHWSMAQALRTSTAVAWDAAVFEGLSQRYPTLRRNIARILCQRLEELEERFREVSTEKVAARLSRQLVRLLNQVGRPVDGSVEISLSREELAQLTGTTLFTVSRLLSDWDEQGIVQTRRETVAVHNTQALVELSERE
jgi:CRP-like cAMP-binding protein